MNKIIVKIMKYLLKISANYLYNYMDKDKNGELSKKEIKTFIKTVEKIIKK